MLRPYCFWSSFSPRDSAIGRRSISAIEAVGRVGHFVADMVRGLRDVGIWARLLVAQMRRIGVDSLPVALFIAAFTGVVLALQASYTFTGAVPLYFVGTLVGKTMMLELGPVLTASHWPAVSAPAWRPSSAR